jgi:hypothetical protein
LLINTPMGSVCMLHSSDAWQLNTHGPSRSFAAAAYTVASSA